MEHFPIQKFMREYEQQNPKIAKKRQASHYSSISAFKEEFLKIYLAQRQGDQRYDRNFTLSWGKHSEEKKRHFQYRSFDGTNFKDSFHRDPAFLSQPNSGTPKIKCHKIESDRLQTDPGFTEKIDTISQGFYLKNYWSNSSRSKPVSNFVSQTDLKSPLKTSNTHIAESINLDDGQKAGAILRGLQQKFTQECQLPTKSLEKPDYLAFCPYSKNPRRRPKISTNAYNSLADEVLSGEKAQSLLFQPSSPTKAVVRNGKDFTVQEIQVKAKVLRNIKQIDEEIIKGLSSKSPLLKSIKLPKIHENLDQKEKHILYQSQARTLKPFRKAD